MGQLAYLKDVVTLRLDQERCIGCGMCLQVCPQAVLSQSNGKVDIVNRDACMECGACARNCPVNALNVRSGVGCAAAVLNSRLGRKKASCCSIESLEGRSNDSSGCSPEAGRTSCC
jgi:ferredoxin